MALRNFLCADLDLQMLAQRILSRRLPQAALRSTTFRASFSQIHSLKAVESDDPLQV